MTTRIAALHTIVATRSPMRLAWRDARDTYSAIIDLIDAHLLVAMHRALRTDQQRTKFERAPLPELIRFAWQHVTVTL